MTGTGPWSEGGIAANGTGTWRDAEGCVPWRPGDRMPEDVLRDVSGGRDVTADNRWVDPLPEALDIIAMLARHMSVETANGWDAQCSGTAEEAWEFLERHGRAVRSQKPDHPGRWGVRWNFVVAPTPERPAVEIPVRDTPA